MKRDREVAAVLRAFNRLSGEQQRVVHREVARTVAPMYRVLYLERWAAGTANAHARRATA